MQGNRQTVCIVGRILILPLVLAATANAADGIGIGVGRESGARLLERCEPALRLIEAGSRLPLDDAEYANAQSCIGFVEGFLWGHGWAAWRENRDMYYCPPDGLSARQAVPVTVAYLRAHPDRLDAPAHVLLFSALSEAYPCTPANPK